MLGRTICMCFILYRQIKRKYNDVMKQINNERANGAINIWMIFTIILAILFIGVAVFAGWAYINYEEQKTNVDNKIAVAVTDAKKVQADADLKILADSEKEPNREFVGPDDYGRVTFSYPKTWSVYVSNEATSGGTYKSYLNPIVIPPINDTQRLAIRMMIEEKSYEQVVASYDALVKKGSLVSSSVSVDGNSGTRLDGNFTKDIRGSAVVYKIRDKTLTIRTDVSTFLEDFNKLITTIKFNQ